MRSMTFQLAPTGATQAGMPELPSNPHLSTCTAGGGYTTGKMKNKKELVNYALKELIRKVKRKKLLDLEGKVEWTGDLGKMRKSRV